MKIQIVKTSLGDSHILYMNDKKRDYILLDTKRTSYPADRFKFKVCDMVLNWEKEMIDSAIVDGLRYRIKIKDKGEERIFYFINKFPEDIFLLENLIQEVVGELK